jgi:ABC-2 type transport system permease protein
LSGTLGANLRVVAALGLRSVKQTFRRPQLMAPIVVFPTLLLAIQVGGAGSAIHLHVGGVSFPHVDSFLQFMLAGAMMQSLMLAGNSGGIALAVDIEMGFTDRLFAAPISRFSIVLGRLTGTAALGALSAVWFLVIGLIFGVPIEEGIPGVLVTLTAIAIGGIGAAIALRTGSSSVVQGMFPFVFVVLFLSSAFFPQNLMLEPAQTIAKYNPLSFIVDGLRDAIVFGFSSSVMLDALLSVLGIASFGLLMSAAALRRRVRTGG